MEIPPSSSTAQISAYFTGFSEEEKQKQFLDIYPFTVPFKPTNSLDVIPASSSSGTPTEFKTEDFKYAWQMYLGQMMYPFDNIAQVTHHQFDPLYFDGSEERAAAFNVQENLIGFPLDSPQLVDPRVSYIDSLMKMREYTAGNIPLDSSYLNTLFMSTTEKGANYYLNQLKDLDEAMGKSAREGYAIKNSVEIPEDLYRKHAERGVPTHSKLDSSIKSRFMETHSTTATTQSNYRREQMKQAEFINEPFPIPVTKKTPPDEQYYNSRPPPPPPGDDDYFQGAMPEEKSESRRSKRKRKQEQREAAMEQKRLKREQKRASRKPPVEYIDFDNDRGGDDDTSPGGSAGGLKEESRNDDAVDRGPEIVVYDDDVVRENRHRKFADRIKLPDRNPYEVGDSAEEFFKRGSSMKGKTTFENFKKLNKDFRGNVDKALVPSKSDSKVEKLAKEGLSILNEREKKTEKAVGRIGTAALSDLVTLGLVGGATYWWNNYNPRKVKDIKEFNV